MSAVANIVLLCINTKIIFLILEMQNNFLFSDASIITSIAMPQLNHFEFFGQHFRNFTVRFESPSGHMRT